MLIQRNMFSSDEYPCPISLNPTTRCIHICFKWIPSLFPFMTYFHCSSNHISDRYREIKLFPFWCYIPLKFTLLLLAHNYVSFLASHLSDTWRLASSTRSTSVLLKWFVYEVMAFQGYFRKYHSM